MSNSPLRRRLGLDLEAPAEPQRPELHTEPEPEGGTSWRTLEPIEAEPTVNAAQVRAAVRELFETAIFILLVFFIVRGVVQNFKIEGSSMEPTMHNSQFILVNKLIYFHFDLNAPLRLLPGNENLEPKVLYPFTTPQRGDVIVFEYPRDPSKDYIKRVIALPGETVEFRDQRVYVNGVLLDEPYLEPNTPTYCYNGAPCQNGSYVVPENTVFVMGDNRTNSSDSRDWEALSLDRVIGKAWVIYYPFEDWGGAPHFEDYGF